MPIYSFKKPPLLDLKSNPSVFLSCFVRYREKIIKKISEKSKATYWKVNPSLSFEETHERIIASIHSKTPFAIGRLGGVEASIVQWAKKIPNGFIGSWKRLLFTETSLGSTNAGIRPRNKQSYKLFADIAWDALHNLDLQGVWKSAFEAVYLPTLPKRSLYEVEIVAPSNGKHIHWMEALDDKKVLIVTPFAKTVEEQIPKLADVWKPRGWCPRVEFQIIPFPYLIDDDCHEPWWQVYKRIGKILSHGDYDVAIFGCGGLGLPFAAISKNAGKVGIHLGGHCQLLFGIHGKRHLEQEWFRNSFTHAWVYPDREEVPKSANRVEGGCYW